MSVDTRDILLKAAEDVQSGMWCKGGLFVDESGRDQLTVWPWEDLEQALQHYRCAVGSITVAGASLGAEPRASYAVVDEVAKRLTDCDCFDLASHNDDCLPDDPFEAGQQLAELFRQTAESL